MSDPWYDRVCRQLTQNMLDEANARIAELEAAIDKLAQCKGRFHTEANFKALIEVRNSTKEKSNDHSIR